jgi:hypothetical protein
LRSFILPIVNDTKATNLPPLRHFWCTNYDLDVAPEERQKTKQSSCGEFIQSATNKPRDLRLVNTESFGSGKLCQAVETYCFRDLQPESGLHFLLVKGIAIPYRPASMAMG